MFDSLSTNALHAYEAAELTLNDGPRKAPDCLL
jgi:hypothetical protein